MKTLIVPGYIVFSPYSQYVHSPVELPDFGYLTICRHDITVQVPDELAGVGVELAMLRQNLARLENQHAAQAAAIQTRIADLLSIGNSA